MGNYKIKYRFCTIYWFVCWKAQTW